MTHKLSKTDDITNNTAAVAAATAELTAATTGLSAGTSAAFRRFSLAQEKKRQASAALAFANARTS